MKKSIILEKELSNKTVLVTGGAGSLGTQIVKKILDYPVKTVRVLDINEHSLFQLGRSVNNSKLRLLLGSINNMERLELACNNIDYIIHCAALKNLEITEFNPIETIDTNINGTVNLIKTVIKTKPKKFLNVSTDKSVNPSTLYGTTKLLSEKLVTWADEHITETKFATTRLGNIFETKGNVFEVWDEEIKKGKEISITDLSMKRFYFNIEDASNFVLNCLPIIDQGIIFVPKMKLFKIKNLALKVSKNHKIIGIRKGEKIKEELLSNEEEKKAKELKNMWIIKRN